MENLSNFDNSTIATDLTRSKGGIVTDGKSCFAYITF
jgi:hypothetical protein